MIKLVIIFKNIIWYLKTRIVTHAASILQTMQRGMSENWLSVDLVWSVLKCMFMISFGFKTADLNK